MLEDDENVYKVLAMLWKTIVSEEFWLIKKEENKGSVIPGFLTKSKRDYRPRI